MPRSVGEAVGRAWSAAVYAKPPLLTSPCLAYLPVCVFARNVDTSTCLRRGSARLSSARLGFGAHRMMEENWKEAAGGAQLHHGSATKMKECERKGAIYREKRRRARHSTVPYRAAPRRQAATNRSPWLPRLTAPVLSTRGDRDGHAAAVPASSARTTLSKRPDRFAKLRLREFSRCFTSTRKCRARTKTE